MRIAFAGGGRLGVSILTALLESRHEVVALVQNGRHTKGWRRTVYPWTGRFLHIKFSVTGIARRHGLPIIWIDKMTEAELEPLRKLDIDLLVVGGFAIILKKPLLELPRIGCINCHSSLLPRNRGPNPFAGVILAGDSETGVSFHIMEEGIDTGPIVRQFALPISDKDNTATLYINTSDLAGEKVAAMVDEIERDGLKGAPQDESQATYLPKMKSADRFIDWSQSAAYIERFVRAGYPFEMPRFRWRGKTVYLARCSIAQTDSDAAPGTVVEVFPRMKIATGEGVIQMDFAYIVKPVLFAWPNPFSRPRVGDVLDPKLPGDTP